MIKPFKIYFDSSLLSIENRHDWIELIKSKDRAERKKSKSDLNLQSKITWLGSPDEANLVLLPMDWNFYMSTGQMQKAISYCESFKNSNVPVITFTGGDYGIDIELPENVFLYRLGGYKSKQRNGERSMPFFLTDPLIATYLLEEQELFNELVGNAIIGFCGMAPSSPLAYLKEYAFNIYLNVKRYLSKWKFQSQPVMSASLLRKNILSILSNSDLLETNFILRQKHRAGAQTNLEKEQTTNQYYENMYSSDLILCVRGAGNYSVRLYETLAMGRVPIFIDTDCLLPNIGNRNIKDHVIYISSSNIHQAPEIINTWLKGNNLKATQLANRDLWKKRFTVDGFWINELNAILSKTAA